MSTAVLTASVIEEKASSAAKSVASKIKAKMMLDDTIKARAIDVTTNDSTVTISGTERTESTANRALADGVVEEATSVTRGTYDLVLSPTAGAGAHVRGTMSVEIRAQTRRLPDEAKKG